MKSIRQKFLKLNLLSILLCVALIGGLGLWSIYSIQRESSRSIMSLTCRAEGQRLNESIISIQDSVNLFCEMTGKRLPALVSLKGQGFVDAFYAQTEASMGQIAHVTHGVCAYYFRTAPELTPKPEGFFYGKDPETRKIVKQPLTDLSLYDPSDIEHVGWYYLPQAAHKAVWMEPYYNQNLGIYMVSYVVPMYRNGTFLGVAGMDIDFDVVIEQVRAIHPYETSYACLCSDEGVIYYHPTLSVGGRLSNHSPELQPLLDAFATGEQASLSYHHRGEDKAVTSFRLNNGMELLLVAQNSEINAPMLKLLTRIALVALLLCVSVVLLVIRYTNRITRPLETLTKAAREISVGKLDVALPEPGDDEVGILARAFEVTVSSLRQYVESMNSMAFSDPLTHVKNKAAYDRAMIDLRCEMGRGRLSFGMAMFDLNDLKRINDRYGHEHGDEYIIGCCGLICRTFKHSPVYRVGGDEFVAILREEDLASRDALMAELDERIRESLAAEEPWHRYSIAKGVSVYLPLDDSPEDVFIRADRAMYEDKRRMKSTA